MGLIKSKCQYLHSLPADAVAIPGYSNAFATPGGQIITSFGRLKLRRFGKNGCGYPICGLRRDDGKNHFVMVHRIIAKLFVPGDHSLTVNHIDMNKENCRADNLEWVTHSENHLKGHAMKPEWRRKVGDSNSMAIAAIHPETKERHEFASGRRAGEWVGNPTAAGNISKAIRSGKLSYGFLWEKIAKSA